MKRWLILVYATAHTLTHINKPRLTQMRSR